MISTRLIASVLAVLLAGLLSGCTSSSSGDPRPTGSPSKSTGNSGAPTRPQEIELDGIDPCTLLPETDFGDFYVDDPGQPGQDDRGADRCLWLSDIGYMGAALVTYEGVEAQEGRYGQMEPTDPIDGFPAYTVTLPGDEEKGCFVLVDVADGQHLDVQVGLDEFPENVPPVCEYAHQFASSVMSTLVTS